MVLGNKKGQVVFYTLMLSMVVFILAMALAPTVKQFVDDAREPTSATQVGMDCNNATISDFNKAGCVLVDLGLPYFFFGMLALAGIIVGAKLIIGGGAQ